jgi:hypothetical protein
MQSLSMQLKMSCLMLAHSARHAIELLKTANSGHNDTVQKQICVMQRVEKTATCMRALSITSTEEQIMEVWYRLSLIGVLMGYNTSPVFEESALIDMRWGDYQKCMNLLELEVIPPNMQEYVIWNSEINIESRAAIAKVKTSPEGVYYSKMSPIHALCFNICVICFCMQKHIENETKSAM